MLKRAEELLTVCGSHAGVAVMRTAYCGMRDVIYMLWLVQETVPKFSQRCLSIGWERERERGKKPLTHECSPLRTPVGQWHRTADRILYFIFWPRWIRSKINLLCLILLVRRGGVSYYIYLADLMQILLPVK